MLDFLGSPNNRKMVVRARKLHSEGKSEKAIKTLESGLTGGSEDFDLFLELGRIRFESGKRKEAASLFKRAHALIPSRDEEVITVVEDLHYGWERSLETGEVLFELYTEKRQFEEAERILDSIGSGGVEDLGNRYRVIYENLCKSKPPRDMNRRDVLVHYCLALIYGQKGELKTTYSVFGRIEEADPEERENLVRLGRRLCQTHYGEGYPHLAVGALLLKLGDEEGAIKEFMKAVELEKSLAGEVIQRLTEMAELKATSFSLEALASLHISQEQFHEATKDVQRLLEVDGKNVDEAIRKYREILRLDSKNLQARLSLGDVYLAKGENDLALSEFSQALELDPEVSDEIVRRYNNILEREPGNPLAITCLADAHIKMGDPNKATSILKQGYDWNKNLANELIPRLEDILGMDLDRPDPTHLLAEVYRGRGEFKKALSLYDHLLTLGDRGASLASEGLKQIVTSHPSDPKARLLLGVALASRGDVEQAAEQIGPVLESEGMAAVLSKLDRVARKRPTVAERIVTIYEQLADSGFDQFVLRFAIGEAYALGGNLERAVESFQRCLDIDTSRHEEVVGAYERILRQDEGFAPVHFALADAHLLTGDVDRAILELERVTEIDEELGEQVLKRYLELLKQDETNHGIRRAAVKLLARKGMYQEVISLCEQALGIMPSDETAYFQLKLGEAYLEKGGLSRAVIPLSKVLDLDPSMAPEAVSLLNRILLLDPGNVQARYTLALAYLSAQQFDKAVEEFSTIAETDPAKRGRVMEELDRISALDPTNPLAHYARGRLLLKSEEVKGAISELELSLELGPQFMDRVIFSLEQVLKTHEARAEGYLALGRALVKKRLYEPAVRNLSKAFDLDPALREPVMGSLFGIREEDPSNVSSRVILGEILTKEGEFARAVDLLKEIERIDEGERARIVEKYEEMAALEPSNTIVRYALAESYAILGRHSEAVSQCEMILDQRPEEIDEVISMLREVASTKDRSALVSLAKSLTRKGEYDEARERIGELVEFHPEATDEAMKVLTEVLSLHPQEVGSSLLVGQLHLLKGEYSEAIDTLEKGLKWADDSGQKQDFYLSLSRALYGSGEERKAQEALERAQGLAPERSQFLNKLGGLRQERLSFLIGEQKAALERSPEDLGLRVKLASLLRSAGRVGEALDYLAFSSEDERLMKLRALELASCRSAQGDFLTGVEILRGFHITVPRSAEDRDILDKLALLYERMGDIPPAVSLLRRAVSSDQEHGDESLRLQDLYKKMVAHGLRGGGRVIEERSRII